MRKIGVAILCCCMGWSIALLAKDKDAKFYNKEFQRLSKVIADLKGADLTDEVTQDIRRAAARPAGGTRATRSRARARRPVAGCRVGAAAADVRGRGGTHRRSVGLRDVRGSSIRRGTGSPDRAGTPHHGRAAAVKRLLDIVDPTPQTVDALMKLDLAAGVDVEIKLQA